MWYLLIFVTLLNIAFGAIYPLPSADIDIVGQMQRTRVKLGDDFHRIGRRYDMGFNNLVLANPQFNSKELPLFYHVVIPSEYILPSGVRKGIVINLPEMRLYYYEPLQNQVMIFPIGIGKEGWNTPTGALKVIEKIIQPTWYVPKTIQADLHDKGYDVPDKVPPGPDDPLGDYALRLSLPSYLIHGTNMPSSIGSRVSSGCIRLYPEDIESLFQSVPVGTEVRIIDKPYVVGWKDGKVFLSAFPPLEENNNNVDLNLTPLVDAIHGVLAEHSGIQIDWQKALSVAQKHTGVPVIISK